MDCCNRTQRLIADPCIHQCSCCRSLSGATTWHLSGDFLEIPFADERTGQLDVKKKKSELLLVEIPVSGVSWWMLCSGTS